MGNPNDLREHTLIEIYLGYMRETVNNLSSTMTRKSEAIWEYRLTTMPISRICSQDRLS